MKNRNLIIALVAAALAIGNAAAAPNTPDTFAVGEGTFLLNDEPFVVKAAELHYPRIPKEYWKHRIDMVKSLGMNTVCLYVFWNLHEPAEGEFDFEGQNDIAEFVRLAGEAGMKVIVRPGPYVGAEWEMGGLPWWLLKDKDIKLREPDPRFMERVDKFEQKVAEQLAPYSAANGGPIIMVQVENEYGSYGTDKLYVSAIRDTLRRYWGDDVVLFQCDWSSNFTNNGLDDLVWTMNFGTGADIDKQFAKLKQLRPESPLMCSEFWSGWFDKWGAKHETRPAEAMVRGIDDMLQRGISFSLYMTHGGTSFGHWAGANSPGFAPDVTSYDYDAPVTEWGAVTPKYHLLRETLQKYSDKPLPEVPSAIKPVAVKKFAFSEVAPLFSNLPEPKTDRDIRTMEAYDQGFGSILYRTTLPELKDGAVLTVNDPHDFAQIFVDDRYLGKLDRRNGEKQLILPPCAEGTRLDILVEAMGRINFGRAIKDFKGITDNVTVTEDRNGHSFVCDLKDWEVFNLEDAPGFYESMEYFPVGAFTPGADGRLPRGVYRGTFNVDKPSDTFLNFETWGKGLVYVNGHPLGRIWEIGPQQTLYMPGCWLRKGENEIMVFDVIGPREAVSQGLAAPLLNTLRLDRECNLHNKATDRPDVTSATPVAEGRLSDGNGWQTVKFGSPAKGRYLVMEVLSNHDGGNVTAIAEMYALGSDGQRLSREPWKAKYADSEDVSQGNNTLDKVFDLQESTYWQTAPSAKLPHLMVIDLGGEHTLTGIDYLPRAEQGAPGSVKAYRVYLLP